MKYPKEVRFLWYRQVEREGRTVKEVCGIFNVPRKTYYAWWNRDHGYNSNDYYNKRPERTTKLTPRIKTFIEAMKRKTNYGPLKMRFAVEREFGVSVSTTIIYRYYKKKGLIRRPQRKLGWHAPLTEPLHITKPGEGVQLDVKYIYPQGRREYQFTVLDPYTERCYAEIFTTRESKNAASVIETAAGYFGFPIHSVQTDNGSEFRGNFHGWCESCGIPHFFIPKHSPYWNGKVERVHRTVDEEFYQNPRREWHTLAEWLRWYNEERIHLSLNGITPREKADQYLSTVTP